MSLSLEQSGFSLRFRAGLCFVMRRSTNDELDKTHFSRTMPAVPLRYLAFRELDKEHIFLKSGNSKIL